MRVTTKGRYAIRALLDLALFYDRGPINLQRICERQAISSDYLEQILRRLRNAGIVRSVRGPRGGFSLARPPEEITAWDVVTALEEPVSPVPCVPCTDDETQCERIGSCAAHGMWDELQTHVKDFLSKRTLRDLCVEARELLSRGSPGHKHMFHI